MVLEYWVEMEDYYIIIGDYIIYLEEFLSKYKGDIDVESMDVLILF